MIYSHSILFKSDFPGLNYNIKTDIEHPDLKTAIGVLCDTYGYNHQMYCLLLDAAQTVIPCDNRVTENLTIAITEPCADIDGEDITYYIMPGKTVDIILNIDDPDDDEGPDIYKVSIPEILYDPDDPLNLTEAINLFQSIITDFGVDEENANWNVFVSIPDLFLLKYGVRIKKLNAVGLVHTFRHQKLKETRLNSDNHDK